MIAKSMTTGTYVICCDCGSTVYARDPESLMDMEEQRVWLRCRNNCCGHVGHYSAEDLLISTVSQIIDHSTGILLES